MKLAAVFLALALGSAAIPGCADAKPPFGKIEPFTGRLEMPDGSVCSGTRFREAILTTKHCLPSGDKQVRFQGILVNVTRTWADGENLWIYTDRDWGNGPRRAKGYTKGEPLYIIGNAGGFKQIARTATLAGFTDEAVPKQGAILIQCESCWHGDSGAGVFNARGELVAVYLGGYSYVMREPSGTVSIFALGLAVLL